MILYWKLADQLEVAERGIDKSYAVFLQLLSPDGRLVAQDDGLPMDGQAPIHTWMAGETIADPHTVTVPERLGPGDYSLIAGLYDPRTMERLRLADGEDYVRLEKLTAD